MNGTGAQADLKRGFEGMEHPAQKRPRVAGRNYQLMLLVPGDIVSLLIGKGGATIKEMEAHSGTTISFEKEDELVMGEPLRAVTIFGDSLEANSVAQDIITRNLQLMKPDPTTSKTKLRMLVQNQLVGSLIGTQGKGIKGITEESGAFVSFCKEHEMPPGSPFRMVTMAGEPEQVAWAQQLMSDRQEQVLQELLTGATTNGASATIVAPVARSPQPRWQPHPLPSPAAVRPSPAVMRPPPAPVRKVAAAQATWQVLPAPPAVTVTRPAVTVNPPRSAGSVQAPATLSMTLWIPNERVGLFIGTRGANIKRITDSTRVWISVQKEDAVASVDSISGSQPMRPVLLSGPMEAVLRAQGMAMAMLLDLDPQISFTVVAASADEQQDLQGQELPQEQTEEVLA